MPRSKTSSDDVYRSDEATVVDRLGPPADAADRPLPDRSEFLLGCEDTVSSASGQRRPTDLRVALELAAGLVWPRPIGAADHPGSAHAKGPGDPSTRTASSRTGPAPPETHRVTDRAKSHRNATRRKDFAAHLPKTTIRLQIAPCSCRPNQTLVVLAAGVLGFAVAILLLALRLSSP